MNKTHVQNKYPRRLLVISIHEEVFMPTNQVVNVLIASDFFESNQEYFHLGKTICLASVLNHFVCDFRQVERTGVASKIVSISKENDKGYRVHVRPFRRVEIPHMPEDYSSPLIDVKYIISTINKEEGLQPQKEILANLVSRLGTILKLNIKPPITSLHAKSVIEVYIDQLVNQFIEEPDIRQGILNIYDLGERIWFLNQVMKKKVEDYENENRKPDESNTNQDNQAPPPIPEIKNVTGAFDNPPKGFEELAERLKNTDFSLEAKKTAEREFIALCNMSPHSSESSVTLKYLNWLTRIPWNIKSIENSDLGKASQILNESHFGMQDVKERIIEFLAVKLLNPQQKGKIICLVGPPGTGKTSIAKAIAEAMGRQFARFSVGGMRDEGEIKGHRRTYVGALPGKIVELFAKCGTKNPVIVIDEIDKMTKTSYGDPAAALLELLDPEQNQNFIDHYIGEVPIDASEAFFVPTANDLSTIEPALRDRLEIIELHSYTELEKLEIAKSFLIPKQLKENGISNIAISFSEDALHFLINGYTREAGVRNLEREIGSICRKTATKLVMGELYDIVVGKETVESLLKSPTYKNRNDFELEIGEVKGLAWTAVGGKMLKAQVVKTMNTSTIEMTGSLGDVMKESITTALNLAITLVDEGKEQKDLTLKKCGLQIHFPAGAVPKDGPSAGITIYTGLISALTGKKVNPYVAMTGEIDTIGNVLPVGGLKEKIIAAHREGVTKVIISSKNEGDQDLRDLPKEIKDSLEIVYVKKASEVLQHALIEEETISDELATFTVTESHCNASETCLPDRQVLPEQNE